MLPILKYKLMLRWSRFSLNLSSGTLAFNLNNLEKFIMKYKQCIQKIEHLYSTIQKRHNLLKNNSLIYKEELLHSADIEQYLKFCIPHATSIREVERFKLEVKWMNYKHGREIRERWKEMVRVLLPLSLYMPFVCLSLSLRSILAPHSSFFLCVCVHLPSTANVI